MENDNLASLWSDLMAEPRPHMIVPFPRKNPKTQEDIMVAMVMLTAEEAASVTASAEKKCRQVLKDSLPGKNEQSQGYEELFKQFCAEGIIFRACKNPDDLKKQFFPTQNHILQVLNVDEIAILLNHYYTVQIKLGPVISEMSQEEQEQWINHITESGTQASFFLNSFSLEALKTLLISMANQLKTLQTDKSLPGQPQEDITTITS